MAPQDAYLRKFYDGLDVAFLSIQMDLEVLLTLTLAGTHKIKNVLFLRAIYLDL